MRKVLVINASPRGQRSHSRKLTQLFTQKWQQQAPNDVIIHREVGQENIPHITEEWIASAFTPPQRLSPTQKQTMELSDQLVAEFKSADVYVIGTPMHNWSIPSGLKAYIDHLMRFNQTWTFESGKPDGKYVGLVNHKKMYILTSRGDAGYNQGELNAHMNFQTPYLRTVFGIMGIKDITEVTLENEEYGGETFQESLNKTHQRIADLFEH
ncbi:NAD(P)H dehydrogenase [marine bacterium AO1-C]|nr:NAD(P)H dehydrogenase [marine bacterium AO1-C]